MSKYFTQIHTDGGAAPNPGKGAFVAVLQFGDKSACVRGYTPHATNQQMELAAAIAGLSALKSTRIPVKLITDSQYLHDGASKWIKTWRKNGWKASDNKPLKNVELWQCLDAVMAPFVISWIKVSSHAGVIGNVAADNLVWDTRNAQGDPKHYQVTTIPTIPVAWDYNKLYQAPQHPVNSEVADLRARFAELAQGAK